MEQVSYSNKEKLKKKSEETSSMLRLQPNAKDLEMGVLGAIMMEKDAIERAIEIIRPETFYVDANREVFHAALRLHHAGKGIDSLTIYHELNRYDKLEAIGGPYYLVELTKSVVSSANLEIHCQILQQKFIRRELIRISNQIAANAYDESIDEFELLEAAEKAVLEVGSVNTPGGYVDIETALMRAVEKIERNRSNPTAINGVPSGFAGLDAITRGWQPGNLIILAARPSVGKSAMAINLVRNAGVPVAVWSLEMDFVDLVLRMLAAESETWLYKIQTGRLSDEDMKKIYDIAIPTLLKLKIFFDDSSSVTIAALRAKARRLKKKHNIGLIVVDYLQLMKGEAKRNGTREQEVSYVSRELKNLAREMQIPVIALSQLSREIEKRKGAESQPQLSDLRESGAIEQDADLVMFLYPPSEAEIMEDASLIDTRNVRIAKHRNGELHRETLDFKKDIQLFQAIEQIKPQGNWKPLPPSNNYYEPTRKDEDEAAPF